MSMGSKPDKQQMADDDARPMGRGRSCKYCQDDAPKLDYKDVGGLRAFVSERGKMVPRRMTYLCAKHQREAAVAIRRARMLALMPYSATGT